MGIKGSKWLMACGIGCGLVVIVLIAIGGAGVFFVRDVTKGFNEAVETRREIDERFGRPDEFTPWADGVVPAQRMEVFLAIREDVTPQRRTLAETFDKLSMTRDEAEALDEKPFFEKMRAVFGISRSAMGLAPQIGEFFEARNAALLERGMGMGEYSYVYVTAYYSWLQNTPRDNPIEPDDRRGGMEVNIGGSRRFNRNRSRELLKMLRNQLATVAREPSTEEWRASLTAEIEAMEESRRRIPWSDNLPEAISKSFEPYRERLTATYEASVDTFELARNRKRGSFSFQTE